MKRNPKCIALIFLLLASGFWLVDAQDISSFQDNAASGSSFDFPEIISKAKKTFTGTSADALELKLKNAILKNDFKEAASEASNIGLLFLADKNYEEAIQNFQL